MTKLATLDTGRPRSPSRVILGTAQFGMAYGVTNRRGQVSEPEVIRILTEAHAAGIAAVDTAAGYGGSEALLGSCLAAYPDMAVITKTPAFPGDSITGVETDALRASLERSLIHLNRGRVEALLLHHGQDLLKPGGERLVKALDAVKSAGLAVRTGVSIYDGAELDGVLARFNPDIVQVPLNLFDQRLVRSGHIDRLRAANIEVHARSPFLQGILLADRTALPPYFTAFRPRFACYADMLERVDLTPLQSCLGFVLSQSGVDRTVVGVTGRDELREILAALAAMPDALPDFSILAASDAALVDPRRWQTG